MKMILYIIGAMFIMFLVGTIGTVSLVSAEDWAIDIAKETDNNEWSVDINPGKGKPTNLSTTHVNSSDFWDSLNDFNTTQMFNDGDTLTINETWIGGGSSFDQDLNTYDNVTFDNLNVTGNATIEEDLKVSGVIKGDTSATLDMDGLYGNGIDVNYSGGGIFRMTEVSIKGTNDVFFQGIPNTQTGYTFVEAWQSAGLVLGTGNSGPVIFQVGREEKMRVEHDRTDFIFIDGGVQRFIEVDITGTNDVFLQGYPDTTSGYYFVEGYRSAGLILGTGGNDNPIIFNIDRVEKARIDSSGNFKLVGDNQKLYFGAGDDASITYNASDMLINPKEVGTGDLIIQSNLRVDENLTVNNTGTFGGIDFVGIDLTNVVENTSGENMPVLKLTNTTTGLSEAQGPFFSGFLVYNGAGIQQPFFNMVSGAGNTIFGGGISGQGYRTFKINTLGEISWGAGATDIDITLSRTPGYLTTTGGFIAQSNKLVADTTSTEALLIRKDGDAGDIFVVDTTNSNVKIPQDSAKLFLGAGDDASITYDGSDMVINPQEVGTGKLNITGDVIIVGDSNLTHTDNILEIYDSDNVLRTSIRDDALQSWFFEAGSIQYSTPGGQPGIAFFNTSGTGRAQIKQYQAQGGLSFGAGTGSVDPGDQIVIDTAGNLKLFLDNTGLFLGAGSDAFILYDGTDMIFNSQRIGSGDFIFNDGDIKIPTDTQKLFFGAGDDFSITYNGSDAIINPKNVGLGELIIEGDLRVTENVSVLNRLGIGTVNPESQMHIKHTGNMFFLEDTDDFVTWSFATGLNEAGDFGYQVFNSSLDYDPNFPVRIYSTQDGKIGINTKSPSLFGLEVNGSLNVSDNITSENVFIPQYLFAHTNANITLESANVWRNVSFEQEDSDIKMGVAHTFNDVTNHTFTIMDSGVYDISFDMDVEDTSVSSTDIDVAGRFVYVNGTELIGSDFESDIQKRGVETELSHRFLARLSAGDEIVLQFVADNVNVRISTHGAFGDHPESVSIVINKIGNLI